MIWRWIEGYSTTVDLRQFVWLLLLTGILAYLLAWLYAWWRGPRREHLYWARLFPVFAMASATISTVLSSSIAIALGLAGALMIVRFRMIVTDILQVTFLLLSIGLGMAAGTQRPAAAVLGAIGFAVTILLLRRFRPPLRHTEIALEGHPARLGKVLESVHASFPQVRIAEWRVAEDAGHCRLLTDSDPQELLELLRRSISSSDTPLQMRLRHG